MTINVRKFFEMQEKEIEAMCSSEGRRRTSRMGTGECQYVVPVREGKHSFLVVVDKWFSVRWGYHWSVTGVVYPDRRTWLTQDGLKECHCKTVRNNNSFPAVYAGFWGNK